MQNTYNQRSINGSHKPIEFDDDCVRLRSGRARQPQIVFPLRAWGAFLLAITGRPVGRSHELWHELPMISYIDGGVTLHAQDGSEPHAKDGTSLHYSRDEWEAFRALAQPNQISAEPR